MQPKTIETLTWVLIYGGVLLLSLAAFVGQRSLALGSTLGVLGGAGIVAGVVLIWVRSRMKPSAPVARPPSKETSR